jgi:hypothetical protein
MYHCIGTCHKQPIHIITHLSSPDEFSSLIRHGLNSSDSKVVNSPIQPLPWPLVLVSTLHFSHALEAATSQSSGKKCLTVQCRIHSRWCSSIRLSRRFPNGPRGAIRQLGFYRDRNLDPGKGQRAGKLLLAQTHSPQLGNLSSSHLVQGYMHRKHSKGKVSFWLDWH